MKKIYFWTFLFLSWVPLAIATDNTVSADDDSLNKEEVNAFGYPDKTIIHVIDNNNKSVNNRRDEMPDCNDPALIAQVKERLKPYLTISEGTVIDKRRIALIRKGLNNFEEISSQEINRQTNLTAADRLLELKINEHLDENSIKICHNPNVAKGSDVYLVMYFTGDKLIIDILNFAVGKNIKFTFQP